MTNKVLIRCVQRLAKCVDRGSNTNVVSADTLAAIVQAHAISAGATAAGSSMQPGTWAILALTANARAFWNMYCQINRTLGLATSRIILKSFASATGGRIIQNVGGLAAGIAAAGVIPGLNLGSRAVVAGACYAFTITGAVVYMDALTGLLDSGRFLDGLSEHEIVEIVRTSAANMDVKKIFKDARKAYSQTG